MQFLSNFFSVNKYYFDIKWQTSVNHKLQWMVNRRTIQTSRLVAQWYLFVNMNIVPNFIVVIANRWWK